MEGTPEDVAEHETSHTARFLAPIDGYLAAHPSALVVPAIASEGLGSACISAALAVLMRCGVVRCGAVQ